MKTNSSTRPSIDIDFSKYDDETQKLKALVCQHATIFCSLSGPDSKTGHLWNSEIPWCSN